MFAESDEDDHNEISDNRPPHRSDHQSEITLQSSSWLDHLEWLVGDREARSVRHCELFPELFPVKNVPIKCGNVKFGELYSARRCRMSEKQVAS